MIGGTLVSEERRDGLTVRRYAEGHAEITWEDSFGVACRGRDVDMFVEAFGVKTTRQWRLYPPLSMAEVIEFRWRK